MDKLNTPPSVALMRSRMIAILLEGNALASESVADIAYSKMIGAADDTVICARDPEGMYDALSVFYDRNTHSFTVRLSKDYPSPHWRYVGACIRTVSHGARFGEVYAYHAEYQKTIPNYMSAYKCAHGEVERKAITKYVVSQYLSGNLKRHEQKEFFGYTWRGF